MEGNIAAFIVFVIFYNIFLFLLLNINKFGGIFIVVLLDFTYILL